MSLRVAAGLVLTVAGAVVVASGRGGNEGGSEIWLGILCLLLHTSAWGCYCVLVKALVARYSGLYVTAASVAGGLVFMVGVVLLRQVISPAAPSLKLPPAVYGPLAYWIVAISGVGYWIVSWASRRTNASTVALFNALQPAVGASLSIAMLGEQLRWTDLGTAGIIVGLVVVTRAK